MGDSVRACEQRVTGQFAHSMAECEADRSVTSGISLTVSGEKALAEPALQRRDLLAAP
jgi:hypothetical protein